MKGDYHRYLAEFKTRAERKEAAENTLSAYKSAQRQAERIKRESHSKSGDDTKPQVKPQSLVPVARFHGSRLASGSSPSPYQRKGSSTSLGHDQLGQATPSLSTLEV